MLYYLFMTLYIIACFVLILFVLLQPGKSDAAAVFGGGANSSAFGPRGTQTVMAKITIGAAIVFFVIAFVFATIPDWSTGSRSVGEGVPASAAPAPVPAAPTEQAPATTPDPGAPQSPQPGQPPAAQPGNAAPATKQASPPTKQTPTKQSNQ